MKKENRKMAQEKRAAQRKKQEQKNLLPAKRRAVAYKIFCR